MGFFDKSEDNYIKEIRCPRSPDTDLVVRFERYRNHIAWGANCVVAEHQRVVVCYQQQVMDILGPGRHSMTFEALPNLGAKLETSSAALDIDLFYICSVPSRRLKWGTQNPIRYMDNERKEHKINAFGLYNLQCTDPTKLIEHFVQYKSFSMNAEFQSQLRNLLLEAFSQFLSHAHVPLSQLTSMSEQIHTHIQKFIASQLTQVGLILCDFELRNISLSQYHQSLLKSEGELQAITQASPAYFVAIDGQSQGPFRLNELQSKLANQQISLSTLVWKSGMESWAPCEELSELQFDLPPAVASFSAASSVSK